MIESGPGIVHWADLAPRCSVPKPSCTRHSPAYALANSTVKQNLGRRLVDAHCGLRDDRRKSGSCFLMPGCSIPCPGLWGSIRTGPEHHHHLANWIERSKWKMEARRSRELRPNRPVPGPGVLGIIWLAGVLSSTARQQSLVDQRVISHCRIKSRRG